MKKNIYNVIWLLDAQNEDVFNRTIGFLNTLTKLDLAIAYTDPSEKKQEIKQILLKWVEEHKRELK